MALVKVKDKFQVTLPSSLRRRARISVGDMLDVDMEGDKIVLTAKSIVDRSIEEGRADIREGRSKSFDTAEEAIKFLHASRRRKRV